MGELGDRAAGPVGASGGEPGRVQGWLLARDLSISVAAVLFSMWVTFAAGYQSVYQALILVLAGVVIYAFIKAHRENTGQVTTPADYGTEG